MALCAPAGAPRGVKARDAPPVWVRAPAAGGGGFSLLRVVTGPRRTVFDFSLIFGRRRWGNGGGSGRSDAGGGVKPGWERRENLQISAGVGMGLSESETMPRG